MDAFAIEGAVRVGAGKGDLPRVEIDCPEAKGEIYLHGGHVTRFQPAGETEVIFTSQKSFYAAGKAIRGGIPMIFPWFGPHPTRKDAPQHGFARTRTWELAATRRKPGGVEIELKLAPDTSHRDIWQEDFELRYVIGMGARLELSLEIHNRAAVSFRSEVAFHTYLTVGDVRRVRIEGLDGRAYIDKTRKMERFKQEGPVILTEETDRVYLETADAVVIEDPILKRRLRVTKDGSASTVVWNPWSARGDAMADMGPGEWSGFVCVETTNAADDARVIPAGGRHRIQATVQVER